MTYEYRVYEPHPGKMAALHARFRDHTPKLFKKYGIRNVGYWAAGAEEYSSRLVYMLAFEDAGHWERAWIAGRTGVQHAVEAHRLLTGLVAGSWISTR